jgi:hypothetical protein
MCIIIIICFYSSVEHRARVKVRHLVLFAAKAFTSAQLFFCGFNSFSTVHRHVVLGHPLFLDPCVFHSSAAFVILLGAFLSVCPIHFHLFFQLLLIWASAWFFPHRSWFEIISGHLLLIIIWRHLFAKV